MAFILVNNFLYQFFQFFFNEFIVADQFFYHNRQSIVDFFLAFCTFAKEIGKLIFFNSQFFNRLVSHPSVVFAKNPSIFGKL